LCSQILDRSEEQPVSRTLRNQTHLYETALYHTLISTPGINGVEIYSMPKNRITFEFDFIIFCFTAFTKSDTLCKRVASIVTKNKFKNLNNLFSRFSLLKKTTGSDKSFQTRRQSSLFNIHIPVATFFPPCTKRSI
jgi:hypothetical protein